MMVYGYLHTNGVLFAPTDVSVSTADNFQMNDLIGELVADDIFY
jgi:hypothetical protein